MMVREGSKPHGRDVARLRFTRARCGACRTRVKAGLGCLSSRKPNRLPGFPLHIVDSDLKHGKTRVQPLRSCLRAILGRKFALQSPIHEGRERATAGLGSPSPRFARGDPSRQKLNYFLFRNGIIQTHSPLQQSLSDGRGKHAVERQAIENERAIRLAARHREIGKQPHIVAKPHPFQRGNENLLFEKTPAEKNDTYIRCRQ